MCALPGCHFGLARALILLLLIAGLTGGCADHSGNLPYEELDIGLVHLPQRVVRTEVLAEGLSYTHIRRGFLDDQEYFRLSSGAIEEAQAQALKKQLAESGYQPEIVELAEAGPLGEPLGVELVLGRFRDRAQLDQLADRLEQQGISLLPRFTAEDGRETSGPFEISILTIDLNRYQGRIESALANDQIQGKERTSSIAARKGAVAAVNAGFFAWKPEVGTVGDLAGISVIDGDLVSEATEGRPALVIDNGSGKANVRIVHNLRSRLWLTIADQRFQINGVNRKPGVVLNCGNLSAQPVTLPVHDFVCTNPNELILFNRYFGARTPATDGIEFVLKEGQIVSVSAKPGRAVGDEQVFQAQGDMAEKLSRVVAAGLPAEIDIQLMADQGVIEMKRGVFIINGGPVLLHNGQKDLAARAREGWAVDFATQTVDNRFIDKKDAATLSGQASARRAGFYHGWAVRRHPRTAAGLTEDKLLYVAVVYGRQPGLSAGASLTDMADLMSSLGVHEALNLDGGGSSVMVIKGERTGNPSDSDGEREIGDALLFMP